MQNQRRFSQRQSLPGPMINKTTPPTSPLLLQLKGGKPKTPMSKKSTTRKKQQPRRPTPSLPPHTSQKPLPHSPQQIVRASFSGLVPY